MAHEVEGKILINTANGASWHGLDEGIPEEFLYCADWLKAHPLLAWKATMHGLFLADGREAQTRAVTRSSDGKVIGEVGRDYTIVQPETMVEWFRPFLESKAAAIETVGILREGRRAFVQAKVKGGASILPGDDVRPYLLLANSWDTSLNVHIGRTDTRTVCNNTLQAAIGGGNLLKFRHTAGVHANLADVQKTVERAMVGFEESAELYRAMARVRIDDGALATYVGDVFGTKVRVSAPAPVRVDAPRLRIVDADMNRMAAMLDAAEAEEQETQRGVFPKVRRLFEEGLGTNVPGVRGTLWGAYNAVSEYVQYERGTDKDRRQDEALFGPILKRAASRAADMVQAA